MDIFEDDDIFEMSDEDIHVKLPSSCNPVDDYLIKQLNDIRECVVQVKKEILDLQISTRKILEKLYKQCSFFDNYESSDSEDDYNDWYDENGDPVVRKKKKVNSLDTLMIVRDIWQRIIDDKWIIGVELQNNSNRTLQAPKFYIMIQDQAELKGVISLWQINNNSLWNRCENLHFNDKTITTTVVLNLPNFKYTSEIVAYGIVVYYLDGKELQIPIGTIKLNALQATDRLLMPRYALNLNKSILAIKATSIEKIINISLYQEPGRATRLIDFLIKNNFVQVMSDVYMCKNLEIFRNCIFEILSLLDTQITLRISTRSLVQLDIILCMVRDEFHDVTNLSQDDKIVSGVEALKKELQLKLHCDEEPLQILNAQIITDLFIS